jgi:hypothetical protein
MKPFSILSLARACVGWRRSALMAVIGYCDCSGSAEDPNVKVLAVGGLVGHESKWQKFESDWNGMLSKFGVSELHMKHFAHSAKGSEFESWKGQEEKRRDFMQAAGRIINDCELVAVGCAVFLPDYFEGNRRNMFIENGFSPYMIAAMSAYSTTVDWYRRQPPPKEQLLFVYEYGDNNQNDLRGYLDILGQLKNDLPFLTLPIFQRKRVSDVDGNVQYCLPLQAADFVCYEQAKAVTNMVRGIATPRRSFAQLKNGMQGENINVGPIFPVLEQFGIKKFAKNFNIPPRKQTGKL